MSTEVKKEEIEEVVETTALEQEVPEQEKLITIGDKQYTEKELMDAQYGGDYKTNKAEDAYVVSDIIAAQMELDALKKEQGIVEEEKGMKKAISNFFDRKEAQSQIPLKKKTYMLLAVFLGAFGAHRFYSKQYMTAVLYLLTCWTGFSIAMTIVDLMIALPKKPDENGNIYL